MRYRANLATIEAVQLPIKDKRPDWLNDARKNGRIWHVEAGDWIIRLPSGAIRPCEAEFFAAVFEKIE